MFINKKLSMILYVYWSDDDDEDVHSAAQNT